MSNALQPIPDGYLRDAQSRLVPIELVRPIDRERDALVREIVEEALAVSDTAAAFRNKTLGNIAAFVELSAEQYKVKVGGDEGNVDLTSFDGQYKVRRAVGKTLSCDERIKAAEALIGECKTEWGVGTRPEVRAILENAFRPDKAGNLSVARLMPLMRLDINDPRWVRAMTAIRESLQVVGSTAYVRIYRRNEQGGYDLISLDVSNAGKDNA